MLLDTRYVFCPKIDQFVWTFNHQTLAHETSRLKLQSNDDWYRIATNVFTAKGRHELHVLKKIDLQPVRDALEKLRGDAGSNQFANRRARLEISGNDVAFNAELEKFIPKGFGFTVDTSAPLTVQIAVSDEPGESVEYSDRGSLFRAKGGETSTTGVARKLTINASLQQKATRKTYWQETISHDRPPSSIVFNRDVQGQMRQHAQRQALMQILSLKSFSWFVPSDENIGTLCGSSTISSNLVKSETLPQASTSSPINTDWLSVDPNVPVRSIVAQNSSATLFSQAGRPEAASFNRKNGTLALITGTIQGTLLSFDLKTGGLNGNVELGRGTIRCLNFSNDGRYMLAGNSLGFTFFDGQAKTPRPIHVRSGGLVEYAKFTKADASQFVTMDNSGIIQIWSMQEVARGRDDVKPIRSFATNTNFPRYSQVFPDGTRIVFYGRRNVLLVDLQAGTSLSVETDRLEGLGIISNNEFAILTDDGAQIYRQAPDQLLPTKTVPFDGDRNMKVSPDGKYIAAVKGRSPASINIVEIANPKNVISVTDGISGLDDYRALAWSPDSAFLAATKDRAVTVWQVRPGKIVEESEVDPDTDNEK